MLRPRHETARDCVGRVLKFCAALPLLAGLCGTRAEASAPPPHPKVLLHLASVTAKNSCTWGTISNCSQAQTAGTVATPGGTGPFYFAYLLLDLGGAPAVGGVQLGISYDGDIAGPPLNGHGVEVFHWEYCASTFEGISSGWPGSGGGDLIIWNFNHRPCATTGVPIAGYFYLAAYSPDEMRLIPRPVDNLAKWADCTSTEHPLPAADMGSLKFTIDGSSPGYNPCGAATPVRSMSWGGIKALQSSR